LNQLGEEQTAQISLGLGGEPLKAAEAIEFGTGNDQDTFIEF
jgi:hypothetical protein